MACSIGIKTYLSLFFSLIATAHLLQTEPLHLPNSPKIASYPPPKHQNDLPFISMHLSSVFIQQNKINKTAGPISFYSLLATTTAQTTI